jgi:flagellar hook-associated protein 2
MSGTNFISGLASGIDYSSLISQMISLKRAPITVLETNKARKTGELSAWQSMNTLLLSLKVKAANLNAETLWDAISATSSDTDLVTVSAVSDAAEGTYRFTVEQLAQNHQIISQGFADRNTTSIGTGTVTLQLGDATPVTIEITEGNDTLQGLADAINEADCDISALILNNGEGDTPYQMILSSNSTGSDNVIAVTVDMSGGASPNFATLGNTISDPDTTNWTEGEGYAAPASSGYYTGNGDKTYTFTVTGEGTIGEGTVTIEWSDGTNSGELNVGSGYTAGNEIDVGNEGVTIALSAGQVLQGDSFTVDVTAGELYTIQDAQDATLKYGSGDNAITVTNDTNVFNELIEGLTLTLQKADPDEEVTVTVHRDTDGIVNEIRNFIEVYNSIVEFVNEQMSYDPELEEGGILLGDSLLMSILSNTRSLLTGAVSGLDEDLRTLAQLGITTSSDGTLSVNSSTLTSWIEDDFEKVQKLFMEMGWTDDDDIEFVSSSENSIPTSAGYTVQIIQAAEQAVYEGSSIAEPSEADPLSIDETNNTIKLTINGITSDLIELSCGDYTSGAQLAEEIEDQINIDSVLDNDVVAVEWVDDGGGQGHLTFTTEKYGSDATVEMETVSSGSAYATLGMSSYGYAQGKNVAGTINGELAEGNGCILTGCSGNAVTDGVSIRVNLTPEELASQGSNQGHVYLSRGLSHYLDSHLETLTDATLGTVTRRQESIQDQIDNIDTQIEDMEDRLAMEEERLYQEFIAMEQTISLLNSTSVYLSSQLGMLESNWSWTGSGE